MVLKLKHRNRYLFFIKTIHTVYCIADLKSKTCVFLCQYQARTLLRLKTRGRREEPKFDPIVAIDIS